LKSFILARLRLRFFVSSEAKIRFQCNICGWTGRSPVSAISSREQPSCCGCGSTLRFRSIIAALTKELLGDIVPLSQQSVNKNIRGLGMSDADVYASPLEQKYSYQNSFYDKKPMLDATDLSSWRSGFEYNFVISSDVYEHIPFPVDVAFHNLFNLLGPGGVCIFSVPYDVTGNTKEHFPSLQIFGQLYRVMVKEFF
jgi:hypothetical protein